MQGLKQKLKKNPPTAYIFDADLTAWDAGAVHEEGWREAGRVHGQTITAEFLEYQKGRTNEAAAEWLLGPDLYRKIGAAFIATKQDYVVQHAAQAVPYDDFLRAVAALRGVGVPVWICTASPKPFCCAVFDAFPVLAPFRGCTVWRDMYEGTKSDGLRLAFALAGVSADDALYVGDAYADWEAARVVGCRFVYYLRDRVPDPRVPEGVWRISSHEEWLL